MAVLNKNKAKMKIHLLILAVLLMLKTCFTNGLMDIEELKSVYYGLDILNDPVVLNKDSEEVGTVQVTSKYGQAYQCTFPDLTVEDRKKEEEEKLAAETGIAEMLRPMAGQDCLFKTKDWWSYEFCYGKHIRQFHMEEGVIKGNVIFLGHYAEDFDWSNSTAKEDRLRTKTASSRYHSQTYTEGTTCDLTGKPRKAEVRFLCEEGASDYLARVDESATCMYTVTVMTRRICRHPDLKAPARRRHVPITCNPLLTPSQFSDYMEEIEEEKLQKEKDAMLKSAAALKYGDLNAKAGLSDLDKTLEDALSSIAKELLAKQVEGKAKQISSQDPMTREAFEAKFGKEGGLYDLYIRGIELAKKKRDTIQKLMAARKDKSNKDKELDEDDEIIKEYEEEIKTIKATFAKSSSRATALQNKIKLQQNWEKEIENVIKEAESELGVKVDRSLMAGLSNTLDKLVEKLHDTHEQLNSMNTEIHQLKGDSEAGTAEEAGASEETTGEQAGGLEQNIAEAASETKFNSKKDGILVTNEEDEEKDVDNKDEEEEDSVESLAESSFKDETAAVDNEIEGSTSTEFSEADQEFSGLDSKILPPPKPDFGGGITGAINPEADMEGEGGGEDAGGAEPIGAEGDGAAAEPPEVTLTISKQKDEDEVPESVQKMLQEKIRKEMEKQGEGEDTRLDTDHSFHHKDKSVHIFQEEGEDGKTNKFIMVVGLNSFNDDEHIENIKQNQLEDNYGFKYTGKQRKAGQTSGESSIDSATGGATETVTETIRETVTDAVTDAPTESTADVPTDDAPSS